MSGQLAPETSNKSRERSKTPFNLRSQCNGENCSEVGHVHGPKKEGLTMITITEEPELPAANHKATTKIVSVARNVVYSESKNAASIINSKNSIQASLSSTKSTSTVPNATITTSKVNTKSNQSRSQRTMLKANRILSEGSEVNDNIVNSAHEGLFGLKCSTPKQNSLSSSSVPPKILGNVNLNEHLAYKEYKEAGEYWKKYPKTDYVYSSTYSPFRREIKPGVIAMPNMSRRSLDHHQARTNEMSSNNPTQGSSIRSHYQSSYEKFQNFNTSDHSQDELDAYGADYLTTFTHGESEKKASIIGRFCAAIITIVVTTCNKICSSFSSETDYRNVHYGRVNENKGLVLIYGIIYCAFAIAILLTDYFGNTLCAQNPKLLTC